VGPSVGLVADCRTHRLLAGGGSVFKIIYYNVKSKNVYYAGFQPTPEGPEIDLALTYEPLAQEAAALDDIPGPPLSVQHRALASSLGAVGTPTARWAAAKVHELAALAGQPHADEPDTLNRRAMQGRCGDEELSLRGVDRGRGQAGDRPGSEPW
jgi:hypothetical protein